MCTVIVVVVVCGFLPMPVPVRRAAVLHALAKRRTVRPQSDPCQDGKDARGIRAYIGKAANIRSQEMQPDILWNQPKGLQCLSGNPRQDQSAGLAVFVECLPGARGLDGGDRSGKTSAVIQIAMRHRF